MSERVCGCGCGKTESVVINEMITLGNCNPVVAQQIFNDCWKGEYAPEVRWADDE